MSDLHNRGKALEEKFFHDKERKIVDALRTQAGRENAREAIAKYTGIKDASVIDGLVRHGISLETFVAIYIIPMVLVAWADGTIHEEQLEVMHNYLHQKNIKKGSAMFDLWTGWLKGRPTVELEEAWMSFMKAYVTQLEHSERQELKKAILGLSEDVADSAGGLFGLMAISAEEKEVMRRLDSVFG